MTVKKLIAELQKLPQGAEVYYLDAGDIVGGIKSVEEVASLEDFPCAGFADHVTDADREGAAVVVRCTP